MTRVHQALASIVYTDWSSTIHTRPWGNTDIIITSDDPGDYRKVYVV